MVNKTILLLTLCFLFVGCTNPPSDEIYLNTIQANETELADLQNAAMDSKTAEALYATINANETEIASFKYLEDQAKTKNAFSIPSATMKPTKTKIPPTPTSKPTNTKKPATKTPLPTKKPVTKPPSNNKYEFEVVVGNRDGSTSRTMKTTPWNKGKSNVGNPVLICGPVAHVAHDPTVAMYGIYLGDINDPFPIFVHDSILESTTANQLKGLDLCASSWIAQESGITFLEVTEFQQLKIIFCNNTECTYYNR